MVEGDLVLVADNEHPGFVQLRKLRGGRPFPESDERVDSSIAISFRVSGVLQPNSDGKECGIGARGLPGIERGGVRLCKNRAIKVRHNGGCEHRDKRASRDRFGALVSVSGHLCHGAERDITDT